MNQKNEFHFLNLSKELQIESLVDDVLADKETDDVGEVGQYLFQRTKEVC